MRYNFAVCISVFVALSAMFSCSKDADPIPVNQEIVTNDTTLITGELTVVAKYVSGPNVKDAPTGTLIKLYATYQDLQNGFDIYDLLSSGNSAYFGFINYGTYYVSAKVTIDGFNYYAENAVQVRPNRQETLTITMFQ